MAIVENPLHTLLGHVLSFHDQRHDLIAANIANSNTPGYKAFDAVLDQSLTGQASLPMRATQSKHLGSTHFDPASHASVQVSNAPARLDGNNVTLDNEFVKLSHNRVMYQVVFELMDRWGNLTPAARDLR